MKRNLRVIQINGFRGLFLALFIVSCLIAGFIIFPAFLTMHLWNYLSVKTGSFPAINILQGVLLWAIITFSIYLFNKRQFIVSFKAHQELSEDEVRDIVSKIKSKITSSKGVNDLLSPTNEEVKTNLKEEELNKID